MESEARNTGLERFPIHQSGLLLEERNLDSRNRRGLVRLHGIERSPSLHDSSLLNVVHQLRAAWRDPGEYQHTPKFVSVLNSIGTIAVALQPGACQGGSGSCMRLLGSKP